MTSFFPDIVRKLAERCGFKRENLFFFENTKEIACPEAMTFFVFGNRKQIAEYWKIAVEHHFQRWAVEYFQSENGPRLEKCWELLI